MNINRIIKYLVNEEKAQTVIFRKWNNGDVIALFPEQKHGKYIGSYEHFGQHGNADYNLVMNKTVPASQKEYADLKKELERIGYKLIIRDK